MQLLQVGALQCFLLASFNPTLNTHLDVDASNHTRSLLSHQHINDIKQTNKQKQRQNKQSSDMLEAVRSQSQRPSEDCVTLGMLGV